MWNRDKSLQLSIISVKLFIAIGVVFLIGGYPITNSYVAYIHQTGPFYTILITGYICLLFAFFIFHYLLKLLTNIKHDQVFIEANEQYLRKISWLCMSVAFVCLLASFGYVTFVLVAIVFAFIALILRVVKNVIAQAIILKSENDFTI